VLATLSNTFGLTIPSVADGTRPAAAMGGAVTPTQNNIAGATYAQLIAGASVTHDVWGILLCVNSVFAVGAARDAIVTLGYDPAGGTSYTSTDQNLLVGPAGSYNGAASNGGPVWFYLPRRIRANTSIGIKASVNSATLTALNAFCHLMCKPKRPELARAGAYVDTFGVDTAASKGTTVTPGTASEGSWVEIGTLTRRCWYLEWGYGVDDATIANNVIHVDIAIGDATNKRLVVLGGYVFTSANEAIGKNAQGAFVDGAIGDKIYARAQVGPSAADANNSVAVYAVGG
jgi:hypothetical protein